MAYSKRTSIGVLTASASRKAGGLFWSVRALSQNLNRDGFIVKAFAVADAASDDDAVHWEDVELNLQHGFGPQAFGYAPGLGRVLDAANLDLVHTHGLWMYPSMAAARWAVRSGKPLMVSPRGMLDPWALQRSAWKKRIAALVFEDRHLRKAACVHALNRDEYEAIRSYGLTNPIAVIPNGVDLPSASVRPEPPEWAEGLGEDVRVLLFLGRLHPKKGIENLLYAWSKVIQEGVAKSWCLAVAGWDQEGHLAELQHLSERIQLGSSVRFVGPQFNEQKAASLNYADAFILPSFSEGLPMAVLEAWAYGLPVLMTRQCNLPEGFDARAAVEIPQEPREMSEILTAFLRQPHEQHLAMGSRGRQLVENHFAWGGIARQMADVYRWLDGHGDPPGTVRLG
ncbi:glycosyltransferase [Mesorhizobium sp. M0933]|uniref:glycosyltransferase n=1 Tax=Mesorhizobium sp. M0933 TaxID=2957030 RepID=UPI00333ABC47